MPKPSPVEFVIAKPTPPGWWKQNRHIVMLVVGLLVGSWLVSGHDSTATPSRTNQDHPSRRCRNQGVSKRSDAT